VIGKWNVAFGNLSSGLRGSWEREEIEMPTVPLFSMKGRGSGLAALPPHFWLEYFIWLFTELIPCVAGEDEGIVGIAEGEA
jgi:hypothetical protein